MGHKRHPCIQLVVALERILVVVGRRAFVGVAFVEVAFVEVALEEHNRLALEHNQLAFVEHKQRPCIQLVVALVHNLVVAYMGQQEGKMGRAYSQVVGRHLEVDIRHIQVLVVVVVAVVVGPFHWHCLLLPLRLVVVLGVAVVVVVVGFGHYHQYRFHQHPLFGFVHPLVVFVHPLVAFERPLVVLLLVHHHWLKLVLLEEPYHLG